MYIEMHLEKTHTDKHLKCACQEFGVKKENLGVPSGLQSTVYRSEAPKLFLFLAFSVPVGQKKYLPVPFIK